MIVLGLDPSLTNFGWALYDSTATGKARCPARGRFKTKSSELFVSRFMSLRQSLIDLVEKYNPDKIGVESVVFHSSYSEGMYALFVYVNEALFSLHKDVLYLAPSQVKSFSRPIGAFPEGWKMDKPEMVKCAKEHTGGVGKWNHNEADAYLIAVMASRFWLLKDGLIQEDDLSSLEEELFTKKHTFSRGKKKGVTEYRGLIYKKNDRYYEWSKEIEDGKEKKK